MTDQLYLTVRHQAIKVFVNTVYPILLKRRVKRVGGKDKIEVVFFAMNIAMWRYQGVYELLSKDKRFNCHIVLTGARQYSPEQRKESLIQMRRFFDSRGIEYFDYDEANDTGYDVRNMINPDILFYPQPYEAQYVKSHSFVRYSSKLLCYISYSLNVVKSYQFVYDHALHNLAWKVYCPNYLERDTAQRVAKNHGRNWVVSGYVNIDQYCDDRIIDVWKIEDRSIKRLIWAPHFTIYPDRCLLQARSNFLWMAQLMLDIAMKYSNRLQIAFKPHPWLKTELYNHPDWGKETTDKYYDCWANMDNTQLETGAFIDLFKSSDAMIHDCASFTAEYLYVNKPVAFVSKDIGELKSDHNDFGRSALDQHYIVSDEANVMTFVEDVVLAGNDFMKDKRTVFYNTVLKPNISGSTSQFIVNDIKRSLGIDD